MGFRAFVEFRAALCQVFVPMRFVEIMGSF